MSSNWIKILIWAAVIGAIFVYMWRQGQIRKVAVYCQETWVELLKCSWPTWGELKGSTVVIAITIILLGGFTVVVDFAFNYIFFKHYFL